MNFSNSNIWNNSFVLRYSVNKIKKINDLYFYENNNLLKCQHFFEFNITDDDFKKMKNEINKNKVLKFSYLNDSVLTKKLNNWAKKNNFNCQVLDEWEAPRLVLNSKQDISEYFKRNSHSQITKNYKKYCIEKSKYKFYNSSINDSLWLWNFVLDIDYNSWKKTEESDMKSLDREDLQYLPLLLTDKDNSNLLVMCDELDNPLAYSLMFRCDKYWYAVKWGASNLGRKKYAGFYCLFNHLEYLYSIDNNLYIDFWGRRNETYDKLRNDYIIRKHISISRKEG